MNALRSPSQPAPSHLPQRRRAPRPHRQLHRNRHRAIALEAAVKLGINITLGGVILVALLKLVPYNLAQQTKVKELRTELAELETQVERLQTQFDRNFDPQQAQNVMQEQTVRLRPNQRRIVWTDPMTAQQPSSLPNSQ